MQSDLVSCGSIKSWMQGKKRKRVFTTTTMQGICIKPFSFFWNCQIDLFIYLPGPCPITRKSFVITQIYTWFQIMSVSCGDKGKNRNKSEGGSVHTIGVKGYMQIAQIWILTPWGERKGNCSHSLENVTGRSAWVAQGWLVGWLRVWLPLRSRSHGSWVQAPYQACDDSRSLDPALDSVCVSVCPSPARAVSFFLSQE